MKIDAGEKLPGLDLLQPSTRHTQYTKSAGFFTMAKDVYFPIDMASLLSCASGCDAVASDRDMHRGRTDCESNTWYKAVSLEQRKYGTLRRIAVLVLCLERVSTRRNSTIRPLDLHTGSLLRGHSIQLESVQFAGRHHRTKRTTWFSIDMVATLAKGETPMRLRTHSQSHRRALRLLVSSKRSMICIG